MLSNIIIQKKLTKNNGSNSSFSNFTQQKSIENIIYQYFMIIFVLE